MANLRHLNPEKRREMDTLLEQYRKAVLDEELSRGILPREQELLDKLQ